MFQLIKSHDIKALRVLGKKFNDTNQIVPAIMCLEIVFSDWPNMYQMSATDISELISDFNIYCRLMQNIGYSKDPCNDPHIMKLFNIVQSSENRFFLREGTFLYQNILKSQSPSRIVSLDNQGVYVTEWELSRSFGDFVMERLAARISTENAACREASAFSPCLLYLVNDHCARAQCPRQHVTSSVLTQQWYTLQIKIHFQQLLVADILCTLTRYRGEKIRTMRCVDNEQSGCYVLP